MVIIYFVLRSFWPQHSPRTSCICVINDYKCKLSFISAWSGSENDTNNFIAHFITIYNSCVQFEIHQRSFDCHQLWYNPLPVDCDLPLFPNTNIALYLNTTHTFSTRFFLLGFSFFSLLSYFLYHYFLSIFLKMKCPFPKDNQHQPSLISLS